jgi:HSP20 family protein
MNEKISKIAVKHESAPPAAPRPEGRSPFDSLRTEVDRLFDDFGSGMWRHSLPERMRALWPSAVEWAVCPAIDMVEAEGGYRITAELPGMAPDDVEVRVTDSTLTIRGEKTEEKTEDKKDMLLSERRFGAFHRSLPLPSGVDHEKIVARFVGGVLTVTLPKSAAAKKKERTVEVETA